MSATDAPRFPHSIFLPVEANYLGGSRVDWLAKGILMPNPAVPFGFGKRLRPMTEDNFLILNRFEESGQEPPLSYEKVFERYVCHRCGRAANKDNFVYTHPEQQGTDLCVGCVRQRLEQEAKEPRQVFSVSFPKSKPKTQDGTL